ncbi:hypothetical protein GSI_14968 [Ganoderma sinense ZZ0214-1]|uniref:Uncharacterized protein n=1 Tax=Ganoderma sinense ZZ0214-1 TaxID=1077348 RepID=A0A2G8RQ61_9APHY|nr:hypothetical protein GSI_14968 [Ganoderma sinense ZZ0214-1]
MILPIHPPLPPTQISPSLLPSLPLLLLSFRPLHTPPTSIQPHPCITGVFSVPPTFIILDPFPPSCPPSTASPAIQAAITTIHPRCAWSLSTLPNTPHSHCHILR